MKKLMEEFRKFINAINQDELKYNHKLREKIELLNRYLDEYLRHEKNKKLKVGIK